MPRRVTSPVRDSLRSYVLHISKPQPALRGGCRAQANMLSNTQTMLGEETRKGTPWSMLIGFIPTNVQQQARGLEIKTKLYTLRSRVLEVAHYLTTTDSTAEPGPGGVPQPVRVPVENVKGLC
ncbi:hypothetical protein E2C01_007367 [Portunus trituberculatus]|uniref:Uncharacterized protein n=1 Tax=Portunus trituberculatus TaxID=210409 RepID=A0A5B7CZ19_PORTR|nr:hypothetical protein [Portunus trituberculatus]